MPLRSGAATVAAPAMTTTTQKLNRNMKTTNVGEKGGGGGSAKYITRTKSNGSLSGSDQIGSKPNLVLTAKTG